MPYAIYKVPTPANEPVKSYAPNSSERESLLKKYKEMYKQTIDVPMYIGGTITVMKLERLLTQALTHLLINGSSGKIESV